MTPRINFPVSPARFCCSIEYSRCLLQTRWFSRGSHHLEDGLPGIVRIVRITPFVFWAMKNCEVRPFGREQPQPQLYRGQQRSPWLIINHVLNGMILQGLKPKLASRNEILTILSVNMLTCRHPSPTPRKFRHLDPPKIYQKKHQTSGCMTGCLGWESHNLIAWIVRFFSIISKMIGCGFSCRGSRLSADMNQSSSRSVIWSFDPKKPDSI